MDDIHQLTDKHVIPLCRRMTNLKHISMWSSARRLSGFSFKQMTALTKLNTLKFDSNRLITDEVGQHDWHVLIHLSILASSHHLSFFS